MAARVVRGRADQWVKEVRACLDQYLSEHPSAEAEVYRQNTAAIRVRVVDPAVEDLLFVDRHDLLWKYLKKRLSYDAMSQITTLLVVTPEEKARDLMSVEFDHPLPSKL